LTLEGRRAGCLILQGARLRWFRHSAFACVLAGSVSLPEASMALRVGETISVPWEIQAYSVQNPDQLKGHFPSNAVLQVLSEADNGMVRVRFESPSGRKTEGLCRRIDLDARSLPAAASSGTSAWAEVLAGAMDVAAMQPDGERALELPGMNWKHAQTEHFVIHHEHGIFARKVARMAEFFYSYIAADLECTKDIAKGRSHIFIFRTPDKWKSYLEAIHYKDPWAFSYVHGSMMYFQQAENTSESADVLAHEMTHLVLDRFFSGRIPVWMNEGLAEWYAEFAYAEFKGIKRSHQAQFTRLEYRYPIEDLLAAERYPADQTEVHAFYQTSKFLIAYLRLKFPPEQFISLIHDVMNGQDAEQSIAKHYGIANYQQLAKGFAKFSQ
jgi:hypothetical protein